MASPAKIRCPACGHSNRAPLDERRRCRSCGARIDAPASAAAGAPLRQRGFSFAWFGLGIVIVGVVTLALVFGLPMAVPVFDFEGSAGAMVALVAYFAGGFLVGLVSPGRTFAEPAFAAAFVAAPTALALYQGQTVKVWPPFLYVLMSALGVAFALVGAYFGERTQMPPSPSRRPVRD